MQKIPYDPYTRYQFDPKDWTVGNDLRISSMMGKYENYGMSTEDWQKLVAEFLPYAVFGKSSGNFASRLRRDVQVKEWVKENVTDYWTDSIMIHAHGVGQYDVFRFRSENDAVMFKLTWGDK